MRAGPKAEITAEPLDLADLPASGGERVIAFIEQYLHAPKGTGARKPLRLRDWQNDIIHDLFDDPRPRHGLLSIPERQRQVDVGRRAGALWSVCRRGRGRPGAVHRLR